MTPSQQIYHNLNEDEKNMIISIGVYVAVHLAQANVSQETFMKVMEENFPIIDKKDLN